MSEDSANTPTLAQYPIDEALRAGRCLLPRSGRLPGGKQPANVEKMHAPSEDYWGFPAGFQPRLFLGREPSVYPALRALRDAGEVGMSQPDFMRIHVEAGACTITRKRRKKVSDAVALVEVQNVCRFDYRYVTMPGKPGCLPPFMDRFRHYTQFGDDPQLFCIHVIQSQRWNQQRGRYVHVRTRPHLRPGTNWLLWALVDHPRYGWITRTDLE